MLPSSFRLGFFIRAPLLLHSRISTYSNSTQMEVWPAFICLCQPLRWLWRFLETVFLCVLIFFEIELEWCCTNFWLYIIFLVIQFRLYEVSLALATSSLTEVEKMPYYQKFYVLIAALNLVGAIMALVKWRAKTGTTEPRRAAPAAFVQWVAENKFYISTIIRISFWSCLLIYVSGIYTEFGVSSDKHQASKGHG